MVRHLSPWLLGVLGCSFSVVFACSSPDDGDGTGAGGAATGGSSSGGSGGTGATGGGNSGGTAGDGTGGDSPSGGITGAGGSGTGGLGSGGGDAGVELPIMKSDSSYVLKFGNYSFEVDPTQAAIVTSYSYSGTSVLEPVVAADDHNGGSVFWLAPQDPDWGWPPPTEMNSDPYTVSLVGTTINATGPAFTLNTNSLLIKKSFSAELGSGAIALVYSVENAGPAVAKHAPWEVTRVARNGITFWPKGDGDCGGNEMTPTLTDGVYFWDDTTLGAELTNNKFSCDGSEGWLAHLSGSLLFVKTWDDVPAANQHSVDKEIQLYVGDGYEEVEMRGAYQDIASGAALTWNVHWYLGPAPSDTSPASLVAAVQALIQ